MRHIKTFEEVDNTKRYKKYVLYKANENTYFILEPTNYLPSYIETNKLYTYTLLLNKLKRNKHQYYNFNYERDRNVIIDSDDLQSLKDTILTLKDAGKYNL